MRVTEENRTAARKLGWRPAEFADAVGIGRAFVYTLMKRGEIASVTVGGARIIVTQPADFLASAAKAQGGAR